MKSQYSSSRIRWQRRWKSCSAWIYRLLVPTAILAGYLLAGAIK